MLEKKLSLMCREMKYGLDRKNMTHNRPTLMLLSVRLSLLFESSLLTDRLSCNVNIESLCEYMKLK